jgi:hypothetical protein
VTRLLPSHLDLQHLCIWVGLVGGVAAILLFAFLIVWHVEKTLRKMRDDESPWRLK